MVFRDISDWQEQIPKLTATEVTERLRHIGEVEGIDELSTIIASDLHLFPRERSPYYSTLTPLERDAAGLLVFERVLGLFERLQPSVVVMMWDQYIVKNFIGAICRTRGIPIRVFRRVRFRDFLKLDYFFLPADSGANQSLSAPKPMRSIRSEIKQFGDSLYPENLATQEKRFLDLCGTSRHQAVLEVLRRGARAHQKISKRRKLRNRNAQARKFRYWVSRPGRVRLFITLRILRNLRYALFGRLLAYEGRIPERYILVPLHFRPESAILTQGRGIEDDDVVREVARSLRDYGGDVKCVALEHPAMIGDRRHRFYRRLKGYGHVVIADPVVSTQDLLRDALGVVTISGTVGLEASIAGVPVHLAGYPEFFGAIQSRGFESIAKFIAACVAGTAPSSRVEVLSYIEKHSQPGWTGQLGWSAVESEDKRNTLVECLVEMFLLSAGRKVD
jgi:hypothetical protein